MLRCLFLVLLAFSLIIYPCASFSLWPSDLFCDYRECCKSPWVKHNFNSLSKNLSSDFYGQHLVFQSAFKKIKAHIENPRTQKPLVLSFHGPPGTGKTFFTKLVAENFYKYGAKSRHANFFQKLKVSSEAKDYSDQEKFFIETIETSVARCKFSMFVIDDAHLMNPKLLDVLLPYVDYRPVTSDVSYNRAIFVFISNSGGEVISDYVFKELKAGRSRESITSEEMHTVLHDYVQINQKPFKNSDFVKRQVVDAFVPFLPLEREHVRECVFAILRDRKLTLSQSVKIVNKVVNSLRFFPEKDPIFSVSGCKRLEYVVAEYI